MFASCHHCCLTLTLQNSQESLSLRYSFKGSGYGFLAIQLMQGNELSSRFPPNSGMVSMLRLNPRTCISILASVH